MWTLIAMALAALAWLVVFTIDRAGDTGADAFALHAVRLAAMGLTAFSAAQLLQRLLGHGLRRKTSAGAEASSDLLRSVMNAALYLVAGVLFLRYGLGQDVTNVLATSALVTVILGVALQPTLGHLFSGVSIEIERPLRVGDYLRRDELEGQVVSLSWRSVSLRTDRGTTLVMPNAEFTSRTVEIIRAHQPSRHRAVFHMDVDCSPSRVITMALQVLRSDVPGVSRTPVPTVVIVGADPMTGTLRFEARFSTLRFLDRGSIASLVLERLWFALSREGLALPSRSAFEWTEDAAGRASSGQDDDRGAQRTRAAKAAEPGKRAWPRRLRHPSRRSAHSEPWRGLVRQALGAVPPELRARLWDQGRLQRYGPDERCARGVAGVVLQGRLVEDRMPDPDARALDLRLVRACVAANSMTDLDAPLLAPDAYDLFLSRAALAIGPLAHTLCPRIAACTDDASLAYEVLGDSIDDGERRDVFLSQGRTRPTTRLSAGAWFGWPTLLELDDERHVCRAAQECAVFVWDAQALRKVLSSVSAPNREAFAALLQAWIPGALELSGERLSAWAAGVPEFEHACGAAQSRTDVALRE